MNAVIKNVPDVDYKVRDMSLAELGRKRIRMAEEEMPGLMSCLLYTSPSPRDVEESRMPSSA